MIHILFVCFFSFSISLYLFLEDLEAKFRNQWDQFRLKCLREREDLYQSQMVALTRELNGATIPFRVGTKHLM